MKLSPTAIKALTALRDNGPVPAYLDPMRARKINANSVHALKGKGLVETVNLPASEYDNENCLHYRITDAGRSEIA